MRSFLIDVFVRGGSWSAVMVLGLRLWRGRSWYECLGIFLRLAIIYGSLVRLSQPFFQALAGHN